MYYNPGTVSQQRKVYTLRLDDDLREGLETIRQRDGITTGEQVRRAIRAWLEARGIKRKPPPKRMKTAKE
jgi:hypothetical protein